MIGAGDADPAMPALLVYLSEQRIASTHCTATQPNQLIESIDMSGAIPYSGD